MTYKSKTKLKLFIDPAGGIAGDMFTAALISAGARFKPLRAAMLSAAGKLGSARITLHKTTDNAGQLKIRLNSNRTHLSGSEARNILAELFTEFDIKEEYREFGIKAMEILLKAEIQAHRDFKIVIRGDESHFHSHLSQHSQHDHHSHPHREEQPGQDERHEHHKNAPHPEEESFLHEAQDIVIDIIGAVVGMQDLNLETVGQLAAAVSVGGGAVECSHGILPVPAPAARAILERYEIEWRQGPLKVELATPTGIALLAALGAKKHDGAVLEGKKIIASGSARGTKLLDIPPLKIFLTG